MPSARKFAILALVALCFIAACEKDIPTEAVWSVLGEPRQITSSSSQDLLGGWSPDGSLLTFSTEGSTDSDIWVVDVSSGNKWSVTPKHGETLEETVDMSPSFTPDGTAIIFARLAPYEDWLVKRVPVEGGEIETIAGGKYPSITPDGAIIASSFQDDIWLTCMNGFFDEVEGDKPTGTITDLAWSPAGDRLAFGVRVVGAAGIQAWAMDFSNDSPTFTPFSLSAEHFNSTVTSMSWAPDQLALVGIISDRPDENRVPGLWRQEYRAIGFACMLLQEGNYQSVRWSPDGTRIAYSQWDGDRCNIYIADLPEVYRSGPMVPQNSPEGICE